MKKVDVKNEIPLIVASEERSFYLYKEINSYPFMLDEPIHGNHEETQKDELHQLCLERIPKKTEDALEEAKQQFQHLMNKGESSSEVDKIIGASYYGQVAKLFINENGGLYGHFRPDTNDVNFLEKSTISSADLLNFSAVHTIQKDGQVFLLKKKICQILPHRSMRSFVMRLFLHKLYVLRTGSF